MDADLRTRLQTTLGDRYTLERELGGGGMSRVFVAEETRLRRRVVVKVLPPELAEGISTERFEHEIRTAAALQQANIVPVLSAGDFDGLPYYTMPYVEGQSLRSRLARGPLPIADAVGIVRDVARALAFAHGHGVVHRDIKPDNVLLSGGTAVVTDFGIAKAVRAARTHGGGAALTEAGTSIGTPAYMAPEQAAADPGVDQRADLYSLGCLAFELLAGHPPFSGRTPQRILAAQLGAAPPDVAALRGDVPPALAKLVTRCLATEREDRPAAADVVRVLDEIANHGGATPVPVALLAAPGMFRKALLVYAAAFIAVAVLARVAIVGIGLPDWVFPGALVVMALGLPAVLWTGYVQLMARRAHSSAMARSTIATLALKAAPRASWYRTAKGQAYALGAFMVIVAAFMAMRVLGIGPAATLISAGVLKATDPIIMTDFTATNGDTGLADVVSYTLRQGLADSPVLSIVDPSRLAEYLQHMELPRTSHVDLAMARDMAARFGIKAIIDGVVTPVGTGYVVTVRLVTGDSGRALASFQATGEGSEGLVNAAGKVAHDLRAKAGESLRSVQAAPPLYSVTSGSLQALRAYTAGRRAANLYGDNLTAVRKLREAVRADSTFAEAWRRLASAELTLDSRRSAYAFDFARAFSFRGKLPEAERLMIEASYFQWGAHADRDRAAAAFDQLLGLSPDDARNNFAMLLASRRQFAVAESIYRLAIRTMPHALLPYVNLIAALIDEGRLDAADSTIRVAATVFPGSVPLRQRANRSLFLRRQFGAFRVAIDSALASGDTIHRLWPLVAATSMALLDGQIGRWRYFRTEAIRADAIRSPRGDAADAAATALVYAGVLRDNTAAVTLLDSVMAGAPFDGAYDLDRPDPMIAMAYARAGRPDRARSVLARFRRDVTDTAVHRIDRPAEQTAEGEIALAEHRWSDAIAEFRHADSLPDGPADDCTICLPFNLGRAFDAASMPDSAIMQYELYVRTPYWDRGRESLDPSALPFVHERLGQLYEARGDTAQAVEHDRAFIDLWKDADPELLPRVDSARRRVARLTAIRSPNG